jgi:hypothetical protein
VEATQSDQIPSKVALGCGDRDAALGDRNVAADCSFARLEGDVVGCVTLGIDHAESVTDRHLRPLHDGPVRFDARGGREPGLEPAATPDGRARLGSVFGDRADVIRVGRISAASTAASRSSVRPAGSIRNASSTIYALVAPVGTRPSTGTGTRTTPLA